MLGSIDDQSGRKPRPKGLSRLSRCRRCIKCSNQDSMISQRYFQYCQRHHLDEHAQQMQHSARPLLSSTHANQTSSAVHARPQVRMQKPIASVMKPSSVAFVDYRVLSGWFERRYHCTSTLIRQANFWGSTWTEDSSCIRIKTEFHPSSMLALLSTAFVSSFRVLGSRWKTSGVRTTT